MQKTWEEISAERDTEYRGRRREDGMYWNGDLEWYEEPSDVYSYRVIKTDDGWDCFTVYIGEWNVEITAGEENKVRSNMTDQEYYQWLYENKRVDAND